VKVDVPSTELDDSVEKNQKETGRDGMDWIQPAHTGSEYSHGSSSCMEFRELLYYLTGL
jgi:hypothetical protein